MKPLLCLTVLLLSGCSNPTPPAAAPVAKHAAPTDESRKMQPEHRVSSEVVADHLFDREWLPGGTVGHYKNGAKQWDLVLIKSDSSATAADWLLDYKKELDGSKLIPSFGGFFGTETQGKYKGRPVFIFTKNDWLAAVVGLPQADADAVARVFAARFK
ncbi:MAG TPA: hypothetical protein VGL53_23995 [Bryobacteraceae bacterium]|jgi:hypothetical protein